MYVRQLNCFVMFIWDLGPVMLVLVQMKGHVPHFAWLRGVVPDVLVAGWHSLDRTSMSRRLVSRLSHMRSVMADGRSLLIQLDWWFCVPVVDGWHNRLMTDLFSAAFLSLDWRRGFPENLHRVVNVIINKHSFESCMCLDHILLSPDITYTADCILETKCMSIFYICCQWHVCVTQKTTTWEQMYSSCWAAKRW